jgi:hypothetical protein
VLKQTAELFLALTYCRLRPLAFDLIHLHFVAEALRVGA